LFVFFLVAVFPLNKKDAGVWSGEKRAEPCAKFISNLPTIRDRANAANIPGSNFLFFSCVDVVLFVAKLAHRRLLRRTFVYVLKFNRRVRLDRPKRR